MEKIVIMNHKQSVFSLTKATKAQFYSRLIGLFAILATLSLISCEKSDPFIETDSGKNTLGFMLNGKKVEYYWQPVLPPAVYIEPVSARELINGTLEISANLEPMEELGNTSIIVINLPVNKLAQGAILKNVADIQLPYLAGSEKVDDYTRLYYDDLKITSSRVGIRTCKPGEVLSGTFEFEGDATFMNGTTKHFKITKGNFDVKWKIKEYYHPLTRQ